MLLAMKAVARPYATAVFAWALQETTLPRWRSFLETLSVLARSPGLEQLQARYTPALMYSTLVDLWGGSMEPSEKNFIAVLTEHRRLPCAPAIYEHFCSLVDQHLGRHVVHCTTAIPLNNDQRKRFQALLGARLGCPLRVIWDSDKTLWSGVRVRIHDWVVDASGKGALESLAQVLETS